MILGDYHIGASRKDDDGSFAFTLRKDSTAPAHVGPGELEVKAATNTHGEKRTLLEWFRDDAKIELAMIDKNAPTARLCDASELDSALELAERAIGQLEDKGYAAILEKELKQIRSRA